MLRGKKWIIDFICFWELLGGSSTAGQLTHLVGALYKLCAGKDPSGWDLPGQQGKEKHPSLAYRNTVVTWGKELVKKIIHLVLVKFDVKARLSNGNVRVGS